MDTIGWVDWVLLAVLLASVVVGLVEPGSTQTLE